jgi:hypothetical protein
MVSGLQLLVSWIFGLVLFFFVVLGFAGTR